ncbi:hypothetical protein, partial [Escherichia coli]|uniref:hypothetical protein n=1 Tax=Escherichia coli TaxID=562 RepID=UPI001FCD6A86
LIYDECYINYNRAIGFDELSFKKQYLDGRIITSSVYDHLFLDEQAIKLRKTFYLLIQLVHQNYMIYTHQ